MTNDIVINGEYLKQIESTIAALRRRGDTQLKFIDRQKTTIEKNMLKQLKRQQKRARTRPMSDATEDQDEGDSTEQVNADSQQATPWTHKLWTHIASTLGDDYNPGITQAQRVYYLQIPFYSTMRA